MPRIPTVLAVVAAVVFCIGYNAMNYPAVWEMAASGPSASSTSGDASPSPLAAVEPTRPESIDKKETLEPAGAEPAKAKAAALFCTADGVCSIGAPKSEAKPAEDLSDELPPPGASHTGPVQGEPDSQEKPDVHRKPPATPPSGSKSPTSPAGLAKARSATDKKPVPPSLPIKPEGFGGAGKPALQDVSMLLDRPLDPIGRTSATSTGDGWEGVDSPPGTMAAPAVAAPQSGPTTPTPSALASTAAVPQQTASPQARLQRLPPVESPSGPPEASGEAGSVAAAPPSYRSTATP